MEVQKFRNTYQDRLMTPYPQVGTKKWLKWMKTFSNAFYRTYVIWKPNNRGVRWIEAPNTPLKELQRTLISIFEQFPRHPAAYGLDKKDYKQNALAHKDSSLLFSLDFKNFYKSCTLYQVTKSISNPDLKDTIETYANYIFYATDEMSDPHDPFLATGSPISPLIANLAVTDMDAFMQEIADTYNATYTRYLDDMNFSFREEIDSETKLNFMKQVMSHVNTSGWSINIRKTKWVNPFQDPVVVTGVDIRTKPKVTRRYIVGKIRPALNRIAVRLSCLNSNSKYFTHSGLKDCLGLIDAMSPNTAGSLVYIKHVSEEQYKQLIQYFIKRLEKAFRLKGQDIHQITGLDFNDTYHYGYYEAPKDLKNKIKAKTKERYKELMKGDIPSVLAWKIAFSQICEEGLKVS